MSAHMRMKTTGESVEINISLVVPVPESKLVAEALKGVLALAGHEIRPVNNEGDELYTAEEVFSDTHPGGMIKGLRAREGITQKQMADKLGIRQHHISEMEKGVRPITLEMAKRIGKALNISYKVFL
ncbi:MAG: helix-turn-helix domain-containing protein [Deltaproteobacteria bacterium]|nr:helix-turn-helix domain-containing protein [Deltaproteobacteria bacterium]